MWLTRPREFEQLDQAINNACCGDDLGTLQSWADTLGTVVTGSTAAGIGNATGVFPGPGQHHFYQHWVGDFAASSPPDYWPYAWGSPRDWAPAAGTVDVRLRIDRLVSFGLQWSILKVIAARQMGQTDEWNTPCCSPCRTHVTVWVCHEVSELEQRLAAADLDHRKSLFRVGVIESRDAVVLVIQTPRPIELTGGVCDPSKDTQEGPEQLFKEPVIVTRGFTDGETPHWTQPVTTAPSVLGSATVGAVEEQSFRSGGHMPAGTYPDADVDLCTFVTLPLSVGDIVGATTSELIKNLLRMATEPGLVLEEGIDLSEELIRRLRITIDDE
jgi:hypothetical protein